MSRPTQPTHSLSVATRKRVSWVSARRALVAGVTGCALLLVGGSPAFASTQADPDAVADAVQAVAPTELDALPMEESSEQLTATLDEGGSVVAGLDPTDGLAFVSTDGTQLAQVGLPGAEELGEASVSDDGSVTFAGDVSTSSVNVLAGADAVRVSTVIGSARHAESFSYDFGDDVTVEIQEDGSALVLKNSDSPVSGNSAVVEQIVADLAKPWATDAAGTAVETRYVAHGGVLTQLVEHRHPGVVYPVVADPTFDSPNVIQVRTRFNRPETAAIASGGWGGVVGSFSCGAMAPVCVLASGTLAYQADVAQNSRPKRCVQVTATSPMIVPGLFWWVDTYAGGPCR